MNDAIINLSNENFEATISGAPLVLVDFWAEWCGPCKMLTPVINNLAQKLQGEVVVAKCNVDDNEELAAKFEISSIPALKIFKNGQVVDSIVGFKREEQILAYIAKHN